MNFSNEFSPLTSLLGGILIGVAATIMILFNGKIAGISGIIKGLELKNLKANHWRLVFILGLIIGGSIYTLKFDQMSAKFFNISVTKSIIAGLLVGIGASLGSGCTSGHGVCGISRLSKRSIIATLTFMTTAFLTVYFLKITQV